MNSKKEDSCIIIAVYCQTRCFFNIGLTFKTDALVRYASMNRENVYYFEKELTYTVNCPINFDSKAVQVYSKVYIGNANVIINPDNAKEKTSILVPTQNYELNSEKEKANTVDLNISANKGKTNLPRMIISNIITHESEAVLFYRISESTQFQRMEVSNAFNYFNIPLSLNFKGYLPLESSYKSVLLNISTNSFKINDFIFYAKFIKVDKATEKKVEDFNTDTDFGQDEIIGKYDRINKMVI